MYLVACGFLVWLIIPGIGLLYGGLARRNSALAMLFQSLYGLFYYNILVDILGFFSGLLADRYPVHW
jgi:ammonia channel protein AmtB